MNPDGAKAFILQRLENELKPSLFYHNIEHTLDVYQAIRRLNNLEGVEGNALIHLETAALYHDSGMIVQYVNHEEASVGIAEEALPCFGYSREDISEISRLIMVTKLPQNPKDFAEKIICDADLDYLGREDFLIHAFKLKVEWEVNKIRPTTLRQWFDIQVQFLTRHTYFTASAMKLRNNRKQKNLDEIIQFLTVLND